MEELACVVNEQKPDIILVTETWAHSDINNAHLALEGYEIQPDLRKDREDTTQGRGGGLLVYTKSGLTITPLANENNFYQYCSFKLKDITIFLIYRSPNATQESIDNLAALLRSAGKNSILIGDFNLPEVNWETGLAPGRLGALMAAIEDGLMDQLVDYPTHIKGNTLDLVFTNIPDRVSSTRAIGRLGASDHEILLVELQCESSKEVVKEVTNGEGQIGMP